MQDLGLQAPLELPEDGHSTPVWVVHLRELDLILVALSPFRIFQDFCIKQIAVPWIHEIWQISISELRSHQPLPISRTRLLPCCPPGHHPFGHQALLLKAALPKSEPCELWQCPGQGQELCPAPRCGAALPPLLLGLCTQAGRGRLHGRHNEQKSTVLSSF